MKVGFLGIIFALSVLGLWAESGNFSLPKLTPLPGTYSNEVSIQASAPEGVRLQVQLLGVDHGDIRPWPGHIMLRALAGEVRTTSFRLTETWSSGQSVSKDFTYIVRGQVDTLPTVSPAPGWYSSPQLIEGHLPPGWSANIGNRPVVFPLSLDPGVGQVMNATIQVRGPHDALTQWKYRVDRSDQPNSSLDILSPIQGEWANRQSLVVSANGIDEIRWNWGQKWDLSHSQVYGSPTPLEGKGALAITVGVRSRIDGTWITQTVHWSQKDHVLPAGWPETCLSNRMPSFPALSPDVKVSLDDGNHWSSGSVSSPFDMTEGIERRWGTRIQTSDGVLRTFYVVDSRPPEPPLLGFWDGWNPQLSFSGQSDKAYRVTWKHVDGTQSVDDVEVWGPCGQWKVPDNCVSAVVQSLDQNDSPSSQINFMETGWVIPKFEPWNDPEQNKQSESGLEGIYVPIRDGFLPVYALSSEASVEAPDQKSPLLNGFLIPEEPQGGDRSWFVRLAWRDPQGLIGPASPPIALRRDFVPPETPSILVNGSLVEIVEPTNPAGVHLFWAQSDQRAVTDSELTFLPYKGPLDVGTLPQTTGPFWLHARAQDLAGNWSPTRLNVYFDGTTATHLELLNADEDPAVGEVPVRDGGVYPWKSVHLKLSGTLSRMWVGIASGRLTLPDDWRTSLIVWNRPLILSLGDEKRGTFCVFWNQRTDTGWAWPQPKVVSFTLDIGKPASITIGAVPQAPQFDKFVLIAGPGQTGDQLFYTTTVAQHSLASPVLKGAPWPGRLVLSTVAGTRQTYQVGIVARSVSGQWGEPQVLGPITIDRVPPPDLSFPISPFQFTSHPVKLFRLDGKMVVHYTMTTDRNFPSLPNRDSLSYPEEGLILSGKAGSCVLYRLRFRPFSPSGVAGDPSQGFTVVVDRTTELNPASNRLKKLPGENLISIKGLTKTNISNQPIVLTLSGPPGALLRGEILQGTGPLATVSSQSPVQTSKLALGGPKGTDQVYQLAFQGYSPQGQALTPVFRATVRVDQLNPDLPHALIESSATTPSLRLMMKEGRSDELVEYRWAWQSFPKGTGNSDWKLLPTGGAVFSAPDRLLTTLYAQIRTVDEAGNFSATQTLTQVLDQNVIYCAPGSQGDGTRASPWGDLVQAIETAHRQGKTQILLAEGTYPTHQPIEIGGLQVYGGFKLKSWEETLTRSRSQIVAVGPFKGDSLLGSSHLDWSIQKVDLSNGEIPLAQGVLVDAGLVRVEDSNWHWIHVLQGWHQNGGGISTENIDVDYSNQPLGNLLHFESLRWNAKNLRLQSTARSGSSLIVLENVQATIRQSQIVSTASGAYGSFLSAHQGSFVADELSVAMGEGTDRTTGFLFDGVDVQLWNTRLTLNGEKSNVAVQTKGGKFDCEKSSVLVKSGSDFNQGFVFDQTDSQIVETSLDIVSGSYQGAFSLQGGRLSMESTSMILEGGGMRAWGVQVLKDSQVDWRGTKWILNNPSTTEGPLVLKNGDWLKGSNIQDTEVQGWSK